MNTTTLFGMDGQLIKLGKTAGTVGLNLTVGHLPEGVRVEGMETGRSARCCGVI